MRVRTAGPETFAALPTAAVVVGAMGIALIIGLSLGTIYAVWARADIGTGLSAADWAAIRFTVVQATLSAALSLLLAIPLARALARRTFPGRRVLITLLGAPFILPVIVAVLGILAVFGRNGLVSQMLETIGINPVSIYGLGGVVLAHVFFNLPLATRFLLQGWSAIPTERLRLAAALGCGPRDIFRHLEWPMLKASGPRAFVLIFLICLTSFAVALTLGGGPRATTIELAIYQAFTFDFDLQRAARLALVQVGLGLVGGIVALLLTVSTAFGAGLDRPAERWDANGAVPRLVDATAIALLAAFLLLPLTMIVVRGLPNFGALPMPVIWSALRSLIVALTSVAIMLMLALPLSLLAARIGGAMVEGPGLLLVSASPLVMGTGLFIMIFPLADPSALALPVTALVNAAAALPFVLRVLVPAVGEAEHDFARLAASLGMPAYARIRLVTLPRIRAPLYFGTALTAALSVGDLGVITLFAASDSPTLPLMIYRLMGAYRMADAASAALLLLILSLLIFWIIDKGGQRDAGT